VSTESDKIMLEQFWIFCRWCWKILPKSCQNCRIFITAVEIRFYCITCVGHSTDLLCISAKTTDQANCYKVCEFASVYLLHLISQKKVTMTGH